MYDITVGDEYWISKLNGANNNGKICPQILCGMIWEYKLELVHTTNLIVT